MEAVCAHPATFISCIFGVKTPEMILIESEAKSKSDLCLVGLMYFTGSGVIQEMNSDRSKCGTV